MPSERAGTATPDDRTIRPRGEIDLANVAVIVHPVDEALAQGVKHIVVDLAEVTYFGSPVLGALLDGRKRCEAAGATFNVRVVDERQRRLFEITGLVALLEQTDAPDA